MMKRAESNREQLLHLGVTVCPPLLSSMLAPKGCVGDHVTCPIFVTEQEVATLEVFFAAPLIAPSSGRIPHGACYRSERRSWYDICIHPKGLSDAGTDRRRSQRPTFGDYSWLRVDLKPSELTVLEGYGVSTTSTPTPGTQSWRARVVLLLCQWVRNAWLIKEHENFTNTVGIHERLAFEYYSFLCGIAETSQQWDTASIRSNPATWMQLHPRVIMYFDSIASSSSTLTFGGASRVRCRIPLLQDTEVASRIDRQLLLWMDLRGKLLDLPTARRSHNRLKLEATLRMDLGLMNSVAYRVDGERVHCSFEHAATSTSSGEHADWSACRDVLQVSTPYFLAEDLPYQNRDNSSPSLSPRAVNDVAPSASLRGIPPFAVLHRLQNATIMEYLPTLEENIIEHCVDTPVHYLSLLWAITEHFGRPIDFSTIMWNDGGRESDKRSATFLAPWPQELRILVEVIYKGGRVLPTVAVRCPGVMIPGTTNPLQTVARLHEGALLFSTHQSLFNVQTMAQVILESVNKRCEQMWSIIETARREDQEKVMGEESQRRLELLTGEGEAIGIITNQEAEDVTLRHAAVQQVIAPVPTHVDPVMELFSCPPQRTHAHVQLFEEDYLSVLQPPIRTRESVRREDTAFPRSTLIATPEGELEMTPAALELSEPHKDADGNETPVQHVTMNLVADASQDVLCSSHRELSPEQVRRHAADAILTTEPVEESDDIPTCSDHVSTADAMKTDENGEHTAEATAAGDEAVALSSEDTPNDVVVAVPGDPTLSRDATTIAGEVDVSLPSPALIDAPPIDGLSPSTGAE